MNTKSTANSFVDLLRAARLARGETLAQIAIRTGISLPHLSNLEHGRRAPAHEHVMALAEALGVTGVQRQRWLVLAGLAHIPVGLREAVESALDRPGTTSSSSSSRPR